MFIKNYKDVHWRTAHTWIPSFAVLTSRKEGSYYIRPRLRNCGGGGWFQQERNTRSSNYNQRSVDVNAVCCLSISRVVVFCALFAEAVSRRKFILHLTRSIMDVGLLFTGLKTTEEFKQAPAFVALCRGEVQTQCGCAFARSQDNIKLVLKSATCLKCSFIMERIWGFGRFTK